MPTDTKKTAPKRSLTGAITFSIALASEVPASTEPITNAPRADEKPTELASTTIPRHRPSEMTSNVSALSNRRTRRNSDGIR